MPTSDAKNKKDAREAGVKAAIYGAAMPALLAPGMYQPPQKQGRASFSDIVSRNANRKYSAAKEAREAGSNPKLVKLKRMAEQGSTPQERDAFKARYDKLKAEQPKPSFKANRSYYKAKAGATAFKTPKRAYGVVLAGTAVGSAATGGLAYRGTRKQVKKMDSGVSKAFSNEPRGYFRPIDGEVSKADGYRNSYLQGINPRSKTQVKQGSMGRRTARFVGGGVVGQLLGSGAGAIVSRGNPAAMKVAGSLGGAGGATIGRTRNIKSGDTKAVNRHSGKKATGGFTIPGIGSYLKY